MSLRLLAPGTGLDGSGAPAIDIVAVHGLNPINSTDHAFNTWRKPLNGDGCLWLRDCFPKAQPNARIYLYEYNSSPVFGASKDSFVGEANQLLDEIYGERWQMDRDTPLILMGHSLGGILIKQALVNAWANEKYRGIKEATYALVFFGTPHTGPARNMQVGLGMACAKIAHSLQFTQTSKIIDVLKGGTLFSDLLSESFRHQLEQYKILSCYEGLGDIVPFDSANMCRFDLTVQVDKDNYRKVERNLQMLCADALVKSAGGGASSHVPMNNLASQGGVDISSILMQPVDPGAASHGSLLLRNVPDFAWQVYRLCEQSRAVAFAEAAADVSRLFIGVRSLNDRLETDTFSTDNTYEIEDVMNKCCRTLQAFQSVINIYQGTPHRSRAHWNSHNSREEFYGLKTLKADLQGNIQKISTLNQDLARRSMNDLAQRLDDLIEMLNGGDENLSALSSSLSRGSLANVGDWSDIYPDLVDAGLSRSILSEQRGYIQQWLMNAVKAGQINLESLPDYVSRTGNSAHRNERDGPPRNDGGESNMINRSGMRSPYRGPGSVLTRQRSSNSQQFEMDIITSSEPTTRRTSKGWTHSLTSKLRYGTLSFYEAITKAIMSGDVPSAQKILSSRSKIDPSWSGWKAIIDTATQSGYTAILGDLIALGVFTNRKEELSRCLSSAIVGKDVKTMAFFLENGARFETKHIVIAVPFAPETIIERMLEIIGSDLDHESYAHHLLYTAAKHDHGNVFRSLVAQYGGINAAVKETTPFHLACRSGNASSIQLALDLGGNVNVTDERGDNPLHALVLGGGDSRYEIGATIMLLVRNGVLLQGHSGDGQTALHLAAKCAHIKAMKALMQMGLSPDIQTTEGKTPLHSACKYDWVQRTVEGWLPGYINRSYIITRIDFSKAFATLFAWDFGIDLKDPRKSTYHSEQVDEAIRLLLQYGASVNIRGMENVTPLHLASEIGKPSRMKGLLEHGADSQAVDDCGWTPLHYAVVSGSQEALDLIIPYGIDLKKSISAKIMGEYKKQVNALDLLRIVNQGAPDGRGRLRLGDGDSTTK